MKDVRAAMHQAHADLKAGAVREGVYSCRVLSAGDGVRLARTVNSWALLFPAEAAQGKPNLVLEHLAVRWATECTVESGGPPAPMTFTIVECLATSGDLIGAFLELATVLVDQAVAAGPHRLAEVIETFARLFQRMTIPGPKSVLGLWGELFVIARTADADAAVAAWHAAPQDRYDLAEGRLRVEIKTTTGERAHHFSYDQLVPLFDALVVVASVVTNASQAGVSIRELVDVIGARCVANNRNRLLEVAMASLGDGWASGSLARFDDTRAAQTLQFYDAADIPRVSEPPPDVSQINFRSDLRGCPAFSPVNLPDNSLAAALWGADV